MDVRMNLWYLRATRWIIKMRREFTTGGQHILLLFSFYCCLCRNQSPFPKGAQFVAQIVPSSSNWAILTDKHIRSISYRYVQTQLQIYYKCFACPLQFSHTSAFICSHSLPNTSSDILCNILWHICNDFLLCAFYARFHLHLFGLRCLFFRLRLFFPFCFLLMCSPLHRSYQF